MQPTILAIESSCDETSASIIQKGKVLNNIIATQSVHENYGGVVPELASREHQKNIVPVISKSLKSANIDLSELSAIAFTQGDGSMSDENKEISRQFFKEVWQASNPNAVKDYCATDIVDHTLPFGLPPGIEGVQIFVGLMTNGVSDIEISIEESLLPLCQRPSGPVGGGL